MKRTTPPIGRVAPASAHGSSSYLRHCAHQGCPGTPLAACDGLCLSCYAKGRAKTLRRYNDNARPVGEAHPWLLRNQYLKGDGHDDLPPGPRRQRRPRRRP